MPVQSLIKTKDIFHDDIIANNILFEITLLRFINARDIFDFSKLYGETLFVHVVDITHLHFNQS